MKPRRRGTRLALLQDSVPRRGIYLLPNLITSAGLFCGIVRQNPFFRHMRMPMNRRQRPHSRNEQQLRVADGHLNARNEWCWMLLHSWPGSNNITLHSKLLEISTLVFAINRKGQARAPDRLCYRLI